MAKRIRRGMVASRVRGKVSGLERIWGNVTINSDFGWGYDFENLCSLDCDIFFDSDHDNYAIHRIFKESGGVDVAKKR